MAQAQVMMALECMDCWSMTTLEEARRAGGKCYGCGARFDNWALKRQEVEGFQRALVQAEQEGAALLERYKGESHAQVSVDPRADAGPLAESRPGE